MLKTFYCEDKLNSIFKRLLHHDQIAFKLSFIYISYATYGFTAGHRSSSSEEYIVFAYGFTTGHRSSSSENNEENVTILLHQHILKKKKSPQNFFY